MVNIYLPWLPRMTCPLPEEAGQARRCLIPNGKFRPRFAVTTAICHWTRRQKNSLMQTMLPPSPVFPAPFGKVTECAASPYRPGAYGNRHLPSQQPQGTELLFCPLAG